MTWGATSAGPYLAALAAAAPRAAVYILAASSAPHSMAAIIDTLVTEVDVNGGAASVAAIMFAVADPMRRAHDVKMAGLRHTD